MADQPIPPAAKLSRVFLVAALAVIAAFALPLYALMRFASTSLIYSYIQMVPFVSVYLVWCLRKQLPATPGAPPRGLGVAFFVAAAAMLVAYRLAPDSGWQLTAEDRFAFTTSAFVFCLYGVCCLFIGRTTLRALSFPLFFLVFITPLPTCALDAVEHFLQHASAQAAYVLFSMTDTPVLWKDLAFQLPGIRMEVAQECSGIHSSIVLLLTSLLAGHQILRTPWKRAVLVLAVIPLAIVRNGFRIFTIGMLCTHVGPHMIHSPIHHRGGPVFFVLSLVPFFLLLILLYKSDKKSRRPL